MQTALLAFPRFRPGSLRDATWVAHSDCGELDNGHVCDMTSSKYDLERSFPGINYSLYEETGESGNDELSLIDSKVDLLNKTDRFLSWIKNRDETNIVVSSTSQWLQSFCGFSLQYDPRHAGAEWYGPAEVKAIAIKFHD
mmetsp:Transcript_16202/g.36451  ORF Transcript_16202/g.36451 Transcript_16202/m.36451 type:complete len:140 (+) Transcript_16202:23-442(+)